jgi:hypothetical protein
MNIYQKLQECRVLLQNMQIHKSGRNNFAGFNYFELSDFLPKINELFKKNDICSIMKFDKEIATLTIVNNEEPQEQIIFTSPMSSADLKGCHHIQNLGATQTYLRRYLYMNALEIVEADILDGSLKKEIIENNRPSPDFSHPPENKTTGSNKSKISEPQRKRMYAIGKNSGWTDESMKLLIVDFGFEHSADVTKEAYEPICEMLEKPTPEKYKN